MIIKRRGAGLRLVRAWSARAKRFGVNDSSIAREYAQTAGYDPNIIETRIPNDVFENTFKEHVSSYDGGPRMQIGVPQDLIPILNQFPRFWVTP